MSSMLAFARAAIMLSCLVAVPVFAFTQGPVLQRARQTATRYWDRLCGDHEPARYGGFEASTPRLRRSHSVANRVARAERPPAYKRSPLLPEPVDAVPVRTEPHRVVAPTGAPFAGEAGNFGDGLGSLCESRVDPLFAEWETRASMLQHLGAIEYALEKWGDSGRLYRFQCVVAADGSPSYRRHFASVSEDGARAVDEVIQQVRSWQKSAMDVR